MYLRQAGAMAIDICFLVLCLFFVLCAGYQDLITLERNRDSLCIISDIISPTFVVPLAVKKAKIPPSSWAKWSNDDWIGKEASSSLLAPVTDLRWQNFATLNASRLTFKNVRSISFSVHGPGTFKIYFQTNTLSVVEEENFQNETQWIHYGITLKNDTVVLTNDKLIIKKIRIQQPEQIVIKSTEPLFWQIHKYYFKWAKNITIGQPSIVTIPPTKKRCLMLHLFLCSTCFLEMMVTFGQTNTKMLSFKNNSTDNKFDFLNQWVTHVIEIDPNSETQIKFYRKNTQSGSSGEWGLDLRTCPHMVDDFAVHSIPRSGKCHSLTKKSSFNFQNATFTCKPGFLGHNCNITCLSVLSSKYKNCEGYRICQDSVCWCAWGYSEPSCQKVCPDGKWGLSCRNGCDLKCEKCHKQTGNCIYDPPDKNKSKSDIMKLLISMPVAVTIVILAVIVTLVKILYTMRTLVMYERITN